MLFWRYGCWEGKIFSIKLIRIRILSINLIFPQASSNIAKEILKYNSDYDHLPFYLKSYSNIFKNSYVLNDLSWPKLRAF